jgi:hypothetical protein
MRLNLSDIEDKAYEAIPGGLYVVKFTDFDMRETKEGPPKNKLPKGTPYVNWETTVQRHVNGETEYADRHLWTNTMLHENSLWALKGLLKACGWTDEQLNDPEGIDFEPEMVIGSEAIAVVTRREYPEGSGDFTNDIKRFKSLDTLKETASAGASLLP